MKNLPLQNQPILGVMVTQTVMCCQQYSAQTLSPQRLPKFARTVGDPDIESSSKKTLPQTRQMLGQPLNYLLKAQSKDYAKNQALWAHT